MRPFVSPFPARSSFLSSFGFSSLLSFRFVPLFSSPFSFRFSLARSFISISAHWRSHALRAPVPPVPTHACWVFLRPSQFPVRMAVGVWLCRRTFACARRSRLATPLPRVPASQDCSVTPQPSHAFASAVASSCCSPCVRVCVCLRLVCACVCVRVFVFVFMLAFAFALIVVPSSLSQSSCARAFAFCLSACRRVYVGVCWRGYWHSQSQGRWTWRCGTGGTRQRLMLDVRSRCVRTFVYSLVLLHPPFPFFVHPLSSPPAPRPLLGLRSVPFHFPLPPFSSCVRLLTLPA